MTEHHMYLKMRELLVTELRKKSILLQRIEQQRVPDLFYRNPWREGWVEFKIVDTRGLKVKIPFRPGQFAWIKDYVLLGTNVLLFCIDMNAVLWIIENRDIEKEYTIVDFKCLAKPIYWTGLTTPILFNILRGS